MTVFFYWFPKRVLGVFCQLHVFADVPRVFSAKARVADAATKAEAYQGQQSAEHLEESGLTCWGLGITWGVVWVD